MKQINNNNNNPKIKIFNNSQDGKLQKLSFIQTYKIHLASHKIVIKYNVTAGHS